MDVTEGEIDGNIAKNIKNKEVIEAIIRFIHTMEGLLIFCVCFCVFYFLFVCAVVATTFAIGFRFYYWDWYQFREDLPANEQMINHYGRSIDNHHDHGGFTISQLFVHRKFDNLKKEISEYPNFSVAQYEEAKLKTEKFMKSEAVKKIKAKGTDGVHMLLHYDISVGDLLLFGHILSLILYCDYSKLCTAFSASFRRLRPFETLKSVKQRNACYYWMSRRLRELVECFGRCSEGDTFENGWKPLDALRGPFFTGMNIKLQIPSFAMRLNSPTSTSRQISVAAKFSGTKGVVFTFDNPRGNAQYCWLRGWDCSWISRFKEEAEVLFCGGYYRIKVVNLRLVETNQTFQSYVSAIFYLDALLTGADLYKTKAKPDSFLIVQALMNFALKKEQKVILPPFICDCFEVFIKNKKQISLDMDKLNYNADKRFKDLLFHSIDRRDYNEEIKRSDHDFQNVIGAEIFILFPNVKSLIIQSTSSDGSFSFSFSLIGFLSVIDGTNLDEIIIKSKEWFGVNWIESLWKSDEKRLQKQYAAKNYQIAMVHDGKKYNLQITKS